MKYPQGRSTFPSGFVSDDTAPIKSRAAFSSFLQDARPHGRPCSAAFHLRSSRSSRFPSHRITYLEMPKVGIKSSQALHVSISRHTKRSFHSRSFLLTPRREALLLGVTTLFLGVPHTNSKGNWRRWMTYTTSLVRRALFMRRVYRQMNPFASEGCRVSMFFYKILRML